MLERFALKLLLCCVCVPMPALAAADMAPPRLMLATVYAAEGEVAQYWVSEKLDGVRGHWDGARLLSRGGGVIAAPGWFTAGWPPVPLDGELWIGRGRFEEVSGIVRTLEPDEAAWRRVQFRVFDLPAHGGRFDERVRAMRELLSDPALPWLRPVEQFRVASAAELQARFAEVIAGGGEGLMLHHRDARYRAGRSEALLKYKPYRDAEARVIAYTPGKGKYAGLVGALVVEGVDGRRFRIGSGLSDADRAAPPPIGSWVSYRYNGHTGNGLPRFARFLRLRADPPPADPEVE